MTYAEYLASPGWRRRRATVVQLAKWTCQSCGWNVYRRPGRWLEVHHLTYATLGDERVGDVRVLCQVCHAAQHGRPPAHSTAGFSHLRDVLHGLGQAAY